MGRRRGTPLERESPVNVPRWVWIALLAVGVALVLIERGISPSDLGTFLILIGGGKLLYDRRGRRRD